MDYWRGIPKILVFVLSFDGKLECPIRVAVDFSFTKHVGLPHQDEHLNWLSIGTGGRRRRKEKYNFHHLDHGLDVMSEGICGGNHVTFLFMYSRPALLRPNSDAVASAAVDTESNQFLKVYVY